jgi:hypothetical protein
VKFTPVAAPFGGYWTGFARAYFAAKSLGVADRSHEAVFRAVHEDGTLPRNPTDDELAAFYTQFGVPAARFVATLNGPAVAAAMQQAQVFVQRNGVEGTPTMIVAGKYRVTAQTQADVCAWSTSWWRGNAPRPGRGAESRPRQRLIASHTPLPDGARYPCGLASGDAVLTRPPEMFR